VDLRFAPALARRGLAIILLLLLLICALFSFTVSGVTRSGPGIEDFESEMPVGIELYGKMYQFRAYL